MNNQPAPQAFDLEITPAEKFFNRRKFIGRSSLALGALAASQWLPKSAFGKAPYQPSQVLDKSELTKEELFTAYNNYYEFSLDKTGVKEPAQAMPINPWSVRIEGEVEKPFSLAMDELRALSPMEERIYRFRCVEAWSAVVPWQGYPFYHLIEKAKVKKTAQFVQFTSSLFSAKVMPGLNETPGYPWPYTEGLRMDEARHELTLLTFGIYGQPLPKQSGAPVRMVVPWKYGFKSAKSLVSIKFTSIMPKTMWSELGPDEYGFYANVNPDVPHPRWSQKSEKPLGNFFKRVPTLPFNGYGPDVASLYQGMDLHKFF